MTTAPLQQRGELARQPRSLQKEFSLMAQELSKCRGPAPLTASLMLTLLASATPNLQVLFCGPLGIGTPSWL